jgi:hypothetical protein
MADFTLQARHPSLFRVTDDVAGTTTVKNEVGSTFYAGVIVEVTKGRGMIQHLDTDTMVEVKTGDSVTIDPTTVSGAVGVGLSLREKQMDSTTVEIVQNTGITLLGGKKPKAKK